MGVEAHLLEVFADARAKNEASWLAAMKHGDALLRNGSAADAEAAYDAAVRHARNDAEVAKARLSKANAMLAAGAEPTRILETVDPVDGLLAGVGPDLRNDLRWDLEMKRGLANAMEGRHDRAADDLFDRTSSTPRRLRRRRVRIP